MSENALQKEGPTGVTLLDLPSPYTAHELGLLHLPRFIAKIRKHLTTGLPKSYQRNFTKGFDGFLCLHLGVEPQQVIEAVKESADDTELTLKLKALFPEDLKTHVWNRKVVQMGLSEMGQARLQEVKAEMGVADRADLLTFADMIDYDEERIL